MARPRKKGPGVYLEPEWIDSPAFQSLSGTALRVLIALLRKRAFARKKGNRPRALLNGDRLFLTTAEARREYGVTSGQFQRALDQLYDRGWIEVAEIGGGLFRNANVYALSERWRGYGEEGFEHKVRPKDKRRIGNRGKGFSHAPPGKS